MKKSRYMIGWYLFIIACILVGRICGCDWGQKTVKRFNDQGQLIYYEYTNIGSMLKESLFEEGSVISEPNYFEIVVKGAELNTADIKATTIYGTVEIE